jgi:hypothetical protein
MSGDIYCYGLVLTFDLFTYGGQALKRTFRPIWSFSARSPGLDRSNSNNLVAAFPLVPYNFLGGSNEAFFYLSFYS